MKKLLIILMLCQLSFGETAQTACDDVADAALEAITAKDLVIQDQDKLIENLRLQRNEAIKANGNSLLDNLPWMLIGAAAATVIIGVRR